MDHAVERAAATHAASPTGTHPARTPERPATPRRWTLWLEDFGSAWATTGSRWVTRRSLATGGADRPHRGDV
jgi:hypothetical protein